jgi:hypothetical protein
MKAPETDICLVWPAWTGGEMRISRLGKHSLVYFGRRNRDVASYLGDEASMREGRATMRKV